MGHEGAVYLLLTNDPAVDEIVGTRFSSFEDAMAFAASIAAAAEAIWPGEAEGFRSRMRLPKV